MWDAGIGGEIAEAFAALVVWDPRSLYADNRGGYIVVDPPKAAAARRASRPLGPCLYEGCNLARQEGSGHRYCESHMRAMHRRITEAIKAANVQQRMGGGVCSTATTGR